MNNKFTSCLIFLAGASLGAAAAWQYCKCKYAKIAQEEIDSVKEVFSKRNVPTVAGETSDWRLDEIEYQTGDKPSVVEYAKFVREKEYTPYNGAYITDQKEEEDAAMDESKPYVIPPEVFGDEDDYERISLTYYADGVLADDADQLIENIDDTVGIIALGSFGEYEEDSVFVRNDALKCDFEILLDSRKYSDVVPPPKPHNIKRSRVTED